MSLLRLPTPGLDLQTSLSITQVPVAAGAGATFANSGNICTFTSNGAHGLTLNPSAGVPPNYFVTFGGSTSGLTGTGVLINNIFRILTIPSTTTFTFYSTITAATVTSTTVVPVFFTPFLASTLSSFGNGPTQTISTVVTPFPPPWLEGGDQYILTGANCTVVANLAQTNVILDAQSTAALTGGNTPATAPTWTTLGAASTNGRYFLAPPWGAVFASGSAGTTTIAVIN